MRSTMQAIMASILAISMIGTRSAHAQMAMPGGGRSLGGYGASSISSYYGSGSGGYVPYNGRASGFVPYSGGSGDGLGVQPMPRRLPQTPIGGTMMAQTPIGGSSLSGGMGGSARGGMETGAGMSSRRLVPFGYEGGVGMGGMASMSGGRGTRRMSTGPGFGYPFRMPMSLGGSSSMAMP